MNTLFISIEYVLIFVMLFCFIIAGITKQELIKRNVLITPQTSQILKSICCIIIILHHFALRRPDVLIIKPFAYCGGNFALSIFFILSAYGIIKSDLSNQVNSFTIFIKKRMIKLLKPLWIVNFLTIVAYFVIGASNYEPEELMQARVNPLFCEIGQHSLPIQEYLLLFIGLHEIDSAIWFVEVTLYAYFVFYISKRLFPILNKKIEFIITYIVFIIFFGIIAYIFEFPAHYYRNLWALIVGVIFAVYEKELINNKNLIIFLLIITIYNSAMFCIF